MKPNKPRVKLSDEDGNTYSIIGRVIKALRKSGFSEEHIKEFRDKAISGDYDNLLQVCEQYVEIY